MSITDQTATEPAATAPPVGTVQHLDPADLVISANVRTNVALEPEFGHNVRTNGLLVPISCWWDATAGAWQVLDGQRRVLAAREVGMTVVPVFVVDAVKAEDQRIIDQLNVNEHRKALDTREQAAAYKQLALFGQSVDAIRRRTNTRRETIAAAIDVAGAPAVLEQVDHHPMPLDVAARLVEFAGEPEILAELTHAAETNPASLDHRINAARKQIDFSRAEADLLAELEAEGVTVIVKAWDDRKTTAEQDLLDKKTGKPITHKQHATCPGRVAWVSRSYSSMLPEKVYGCADPTKYGHRSALRATTAPATDAEKEQRRADRAARAEWTTATEVRQKWLAGYLGRPIPAQHAGTVMTLIARGLTGALNRSSMESGGKRVAQQLLGAEGNPMSYGANNDYYGLRAWHAKHPTWSLNLALAVTAGIVEDVLGGNLQELKPWRDGRGLIGPYLTALADLGYGLSEVEKQAIAADARKP